VKTNCASLMFVLKSVSESRLVQHALSRCVGHAPSRIAKEHKLSARFPAVSS
jgi:hypothetical protein